MPTYFLQLWWQLIIKLQYANIEFNKYAHLFSAIMTTADYKAAVFEHRI